ncbi:MULTISPECIES: hypothetical protein [unclassified Microbacterium]|uniref:hypothetical protein n=1 Tax=unclassified Microbacterium TaxID=2609290 RepID=UPI00214BAA09|nr:MULTISPECIES: hypothetical protein [unclassified Microbacterium]MCR2784022.1 hypothetical protein [Microbacterium sp. zg.B96]WIM15137.1 hypothetical protein QNO11_11350 [Microbacterium sp. zg-B96]
MSSHEVDPQDAAATLAQTDRLAAKMSKDVYAMRVAMVSLSAATAFGLLIIGLVPSIGAIIAGTAAIVAATVPVSLVGATARARDRAFSRRYVLTIGCWGLLFAATIVIGMLLFPHVWGFWIPTAILCAIPPVAFVITGSRAVRS